MRKQILLLDPQFDVSVTLLDKTKVGTFVFLPYLDVVMPGGSVPALTTVAGDTVPRPWHQLDHHHSVGKSTKRGLALINPFPRRAVYF